MIFTANQHSIDSLWTHALPHLERFSRETLLASPGDILEDIKSGAKQLWLVSDEGHVVAIAVTEIYATQRGNICCIWAACGDLGVKQLEPTFQEIEKWARETRCVAVEIRGRKGWSRVLEGFVETGVLLEKDLRQVH